MCDVLEAGSVFILGQRST